MPTTPYLLKTVHEEFATRMDEEHTRQNHRIKTLEDGFKDLNSLTTSVASLAQSVKQMATAQEKQGKRLEALEQKPAKRWDSLVEKAIWAFAGGLLAYALSQIGLV